MTITRPSRTSPQKLEIFVGYFNDEQDFMYNGDTGVMTRDLIVKIIILHGTKSIKKIDSNEKHIVMTSMFEVDLSRLNLK
jgi:hypothetical protein